MTAKAQFLSELHHGPEDEEGYARLTAPLAFDSLKANRVLEAEAGFRTNFVTGKKLLFVRRIVQDKMKPAAVIHDLCYETGCVSRSVADAVFYEAMRASGVAWWRAQAAWAAVRACGWQFYGSTDPHEESIAP